MSPDELWLAVISSYFAVTGLKAHLIHLAAQVSASLMSL